MRKAHENRDPMFDQGTPETRAKVRSVQQGALARMYERGHLNDNELAWSQEIRAVAERIMSDVSIGSFSLETRIDCGRRDGGQFFEALGAVRAEIAYSRWRRDIECPLIVLAMIVDDIGWRRAAVLFHVGPARAKRLLLAALQAWPWYTREAREELTEADLLAAHAGLN